GGRARTRRALPPNARGAGRPRDRRLPRHASGADHPMESADGRGALPVLARSARGLRPRPSARQLRFRKRRRGPSMNAIAPLFALARVALTEALRERILYGLL